MAGGCRPHGGAHGGPRQPREGHGRDDGRRPGAGCGGNADPGDLSAEARADAARPAALSGNLPTLGRGVPPRLQPMPCPARSEAAHRAGMAGGRGADAGKHGVDESRRRHPAGARPGRRRAAAQGGGNQRLPAQVRAPMMVGSTLRRRLLLLAGAGVLPLALTAGLALLALFDEQRRQAERSGIEITRALSTAIDAELGRSVAVLRAIALGPALQSGDIKRYHQTLVRILATRPDWVTITLADPAGNQLANARRAHRALAPARRISRQAAGAEPARAHAARRRGRKRDELRARRRGDLYRV